MIGGVTLPGVFNLSSPRIALPVQNSANVSRVMVMINDSIVYLATEYWTLGWSILFSPTFDGLVG